MKMTDSEIIQDYREAKNPKAQVEILADRNLVSKKEMAKWLIDHGQKVDRRILLGRRAGPGTMKEPKAPEPGSKVTIPEPEEAEPAFTIVDPTDPPAVAEKLTEIDRLCAENEKLRNDLGNLAERDAKAINQLRAENEQLRKDMQEMAMEDTNRIEELEEQLEKLTTKPGPDQAVKADAGKLKLSLVPPELIKACAQLEEYDQASLKMVRAKMICKTRKVGNDWKGLFECPFCGKEFESYVSNVLSGRQRSCGCAKGKLIVSSRGTHGDTKTRLYRIYRHILERCESPSCKEFKWYGARGIECEFRDYEDFRDFALSNGYTDDLTVERVDVNGNYSRENVVFIPLQLQARNTRRNVMITYKGLTLCASEWAELLGMRPDTLTKRIRSGWSAEKALETTVNGSVDISLVPIEAISAIRAVRLFGVKKYKDPDNWKKVEPQRYIDALYRHLLAFVENRDAVDDESGLPHLWHIICNCAFLCELLKENDGK